MEENINQTGQTIPVIPPMPATVVSVVPPSPKKKFSPVILFVAGGVVVLVLIVMLVSKLFKGNIIGKPMTVTWWGLWEDSTIITPIIAEYEEANPKVKITYVKQAQQDYRERLTNALAKGTGPDIFRFHNTWVPMFKNELDFVPASVASAADFAQTYYPVATSDLASGTGLVGIPLEYDGLGLYINEDMFAKENLTPPTTWDELRTEACQLTKIENEVIIQSGVALGLTGNVDHWQEILALMMLQNGVNLSKPTGKLAEDALMFYTVFSGEDACQQSKQRIWDATLPSSTVAFAAGKVAMYLGPSWRVFEIKQQNPNLKFKIVPVPQLPKSNLKEADITYATYWAEGVWSRSKNKEEAWKFLKFLSEKTTLEKLYQNASRTRLFGEPYSRIDMAGLVASDPLVGGITSLAPNAQSWYLVSRTFDGATGINTQISKYFEDAINAQIGKKALTSKIMETVAAGVNQVLSQYGLVTSQR